MDRSTYDPDVVLLEWMKAGVALLRLKRCPTAREAASAALRAVARMALAFSDGSTVAAARVTDWSPRSLRRYRDDNVVPYVRDWWDHKAMPPTMDDSLFPFCRVQWPAAADGDFVAELVDWYSSHVAPRAAAENTRFISFNNFAAFNRGLPSKDVVTAMMSHKDVYLAQVAPWQLATIIFSPRLPLANLFAPIINLQPFDTKFTTTADASVKHAVEFFEKASCQHPVLSVEV